MKITNALLKCASKDRNRSNTNGIYLDSIKQAIVATDGLQMVIKKPSEPILKTKLINYPNISGKTLDYDQETNQITTDKHLYVLASTYTDKPYPDWQQAVPTDQPLAEIVISFKQLKKVVDAMGLNDEEICIKLSIISPNKPLLVMNEENKDIGVLMPMLSTSLTNDQHTITNLKHYVTIQERN